MKKAVSLLTNSISAGGHDRVFPSLRDFFVVNRRNAGTHVPGYCLSCLWHLPNLKKRTRGARC